MMRTSVQNDATNKLNSNQLILLVLSLSFSVFFSFSSFFLFACLFACLPCHGFLNIFISFFFVLSTYFRRKIPCEKYFAFRSFVLVSSLGNECEPYKYNFYYKHICSMFNFFRVQSFTALCSLFKREEYLLSTLTGSMNRTECM